MRRPTRDIFVSLVHQVSLLALSLLTGMERVPRFGFTGIERPISINRRTASERVSKCCPAAHRSICFVNLSGRRIEKEGVVPVGGRPLFFCKTEIDFFI